MDTAEPTRHHHHDLVYGLNARPPLPQTLFAALQHMLAMFVGIITPPLIIANALGLSGEQTRYIVSMSLLMSGMEKPLRILWKRSSVSDVRSIAWVTCG